MVTIPEIYVVRVYRRPPDGPVSGVVEHAESGRSATFEGREALLALLAPITAETTDAE